MVLLAIPVIHSSGAWIAASGGSYIAGTLASTWVGSFVAANTVAVATTVASTAAAAVAVIL